MEERKKSNKGLIVLVVVLIVMILGLIGYICYGKFVTEEESVKSESTKVETSNKEELVQGNTFNLESISCVGTDSCEKSLRLAYNGVNHDVKLVKKASSDKYSIEVYIDNNLVDTLDGGIFPNYKNASSGINNMDGYVYVIDSKYLGIVYRVDSEQPYWNLKFYNDGVPSSEKEIMVARIGSGITSESMGSDVNLMGLESVSFDGSSVKYWKTNCSIKVSNEDYVAVEQHSVTFNGTISDSVSNVVKDGMGSGQNPCPNR